MNVLVTGGKGQLATEMWEIIKDKMNEDTAYYYFYGHDTLDITNEKEVEKLVTSLDIDVIVNCAAYTDVVKAEHDVVNADKINHEGSKVLAEVCKRHNVVLVHISTDYVFDGKKNTPYEPDVDIPNPLNIYGKSKNLGEIAIVNSGCKYMIFRTSWLYSIYGKKNFCKTMYELCHREDTIDEAKVVFDQVGSPTNAYDLADFIVYILDKRIFIDGIYHFANKGVASWYDIAKAIFNNEHSTVKLIDCLSNEYSSKVERPQYSVLNCKKTEDTFGYKIPYWRDSLNKWLSEINK